MTLKSLTPLLAQLRNARHDSNTIYKYLVIFKNNNNKKTHFQSPAGSAPAQKELAFNIQYRVTGREGGKERQI